MSSSPARHPNSVRARRLRALMIAACAWPLAIAMPRLSQADAPGNSADHWSLGLGLVVQQRPYVGVRSRLLPFPFVSYRNGRFYVQGLHAGYVLMRGRGMSLAVTLSPRLGGYKASDSAALSGMANRNFSLDGGLAATLRRRWGVVRFTGKNDLLGVYSGRELNLSYGMPVPVGHWRVMPAVGVRWQSANLVNYYYGVSPAEARQGRPAYQPKSATVPYINISLFSPSIHGWRLFASAGAEEFSTAITHSPIVAKHYGIMTVIGLLTRF